MAEDMMDKLGGWLRNSARNLKDRLTFEVPDLIRAVEQNDLAMVLRVLQAGVDPDGMDGAGRYALPLAVDNQHAAILEALLQEGANPNVYGPDGQSALNKAIQWGSMDLVRLLLVAGADVSLPDGEGKQPLETARQGKNAALVQLLEQHYDAERAVRMEKDRQTHEQLKAKAAAIAQARQQARKEEADALWKTQQEAEATAKTAKEEGMTLKYGKDAANAFVQATLGKDNEAAMVLLDRMEDVNAYVTEYQSTPLLAAIQMEEALLTGALLERGADAVLQPQGSPHSPLTLAVAKGAHKVVRLMAARQPDAVKASLNAPDHELSPLLLAYGDPRMFDALLEAGAQVHFGGNGAPSPVMKAIEKGPVAIVPVLVKHQVDLKAPVAGKSLLDWAIHYGRSDWQGALVHELNRQLEA